PASRPDPCAPCCRRSRTSSSPASQAQTGTRSMRAFLALVALTLLPAGALAPTPAEAAPPRATLQEALDRAEAESQRLAELRAREGAAGAAVESSRAAERPLLAVLAGYQRTNQVDEFGFFQQDGSFRLIYPDIPDNWRARLDMQWPIYTAGRADALERAARAEDRKSG